MKPRIKKKGGTWICQCRCIAGVGSEPKSAYLNWFIRRALFLR